MSRVLFGLILFQRDARASSRVQLALYAQGKRVAHDAAAADELHAPLCLHTNSLHIRANNSESAFEPFSEQALYSSQIDGIVFVSSFMSLLSRVLVHHPRCKRTEMV